MLTPAVFLTIAVNISFGMQYSLGSKEAPEDRRQYSQLWGKEGELWNPDGLLTDYTDVGYRQGAAIPDRPVTTNVVDFGADGNDDKDDTEAFRAAIRAVPEDGVIFIPNGTYIITDYIHVASYAPDQETKSNLFPNSPFTIYEKSNFTIRGEDMAHTKIVFPKRLGEIYPRPAGEEVKDFLHSHPERFNNDEFKKRFKIPLDYQFGKTEGNPEWSPDSTKRNGIAANVGHEYSQQFTRVGSFFEFKGVTDTNIENLSFLFDDRQRVDHQENTGGNPLSFIGADNCYVRNIYIRNADSGIFNFNVKQMSFLNIVLDQYWGRFEEGYRTSGHNGIKLEGATGSLVHNVWFTGPWWHAFDLNGSNVGNVLSRIRGEYVNLTYHGGFARNNLYTDWDAENAAYVDKSKNKAETFWRMNSRNSHEYFPPDTSAGLQIVNVGIKTDAPSDIGHSEYWNETISPVDLYPRNIYLAQMKKKSKPLPEDLEFSLASLPRKKGEGIVITSSESATVTDRQTRSGEDGKEHNWLSKEVNLYKGAGKTNRLQAHDGHQFITYYKFDLSPLDLSGIESATLKIHNTNIFEGKGDVNETSHFIMEYPRDDRWKPDEITFNNQPTEFFETQQLPFRDNKGPISLDVTSFAKDAFSDDKTLTVKISIDQAGLLLLKKKATLVVVPAE